MKVDLRRITA